MTTLHTWGEERVRTALAYKEGSQKYPGGVLVKAGRRGFRVGDVLSRDPAVTTGDALIVSKFSEARGAQSVGATLAVVDAHAFEAGDSIVVSSQAARTIASVDYDDNVITLTANLAGAVTNQAFVRVVGEASQSVAIANLPLVDKDAYRTSSKANLVTPRLDDTFFGDAYIRGVFWSRVLCDGHFEAYGSGVSPKSAADGFGGRLNTRNHTFIVDRASAHYAS